MDSKQSDVPPLRVNYHHASGRVHFKRGDAEESQTLGQWIADVEQRLEALGRLAGKAAAQARDADVRTRLIG